MAVKNIRLTLQGMEERAVPATLLNGNLYNVGTPLNDTVDVRKVDTADGDMIQVDQDGAVQYFTPSQVHLIKFWGLDGDDSFVYHGSKDVVAMGGAGHDTLIAGGGNDRLHGGKGCVLSHAATGKPASGPRSRLKRKIASIQKEQLWLREISVRCSCFARWPCHHLPRNRNSRK